MKAIVCEMCGSQDLVKQDGMYVCQNCGTKYSPDEAKKLMVEVVGTVQVDNSKKLDNYYQLARQARKNNNSEDAAKYYDLIRQENPDDWEANFYAVYYTSMQCKIAEIQSASISISNTYSDVFKMIKALDSSDEQAAAVKSICDSIVSAGPMFIGGIWRTYDPNGYSKNPAYFTQQGKPIYLLYLLLEAEIRGGFGLEGVYKNSIVGLRDGLARLMIKNRDEVSLVETTINETKKLDPDYTPPTYTTNKPSGGCYVATAVYGSYDCPQVWTLRRYRDYTLAETWYGRAFIHVYYAISPTLVKLFGKTEWFKNLWKPKLDRMVETLNRDGVANTPYSDRNW